MNTSEQRRSPLIDGIIAAICLGIVAPPLVVALSLAGLPPAGALVLVLASGVGGAWRWSPRWRPLVAPLSKRKWWLALWLVVGLAANVQGARLGSFMLDAQRADDSVLPWNAFFRQHSCLSAYTEAARLAPTGVNVYDPTLYQDPLSTPPRYTRRIGPFEVDLFEYPPPFLVLPRLAEAASLDFLSIRSAWFVFQALTSIGAMLAVAVWIGGRLGQRVGLLLPVLWAAPPLLLTLQIGNFQITAISLGVLALIAFARERFAVGGVALAFVTLSKIFPGALGLLLVASRRWRAVYWTLAASIVIIGVTWLVLGRRPFIDFFQYQLPAISSGDAFPWVEERSIALINHSTYGLVTKLRALGLPWTEKSFAVAFSHAYMLGLVPLAVLAARRLAPPYTTGLEPEERRLRQVQTWLGLLSLASFRSPFVPGVYATLGTLWLLTLLAAERRSVVQRLSLALLGLAFCIVLDDSALPDPPPLWAIVLTLGSHLSLFSLNVWVVLRSAPRAAATGDASEPRPPPPLPSHLAEAIGE